MYVCVCHAVTERDLCGAVEQGCRSLRELRERLQLGTCCGRCAAHAREVLDKSLRIQARGPAQAVMIAVRT